MKRGGPLKRKTRLRNKKRLRPRNEERLARLRAQQFGPQADLCRSLPCCACAAKPPSDPAHVISRGAGGTDSDTVPLCRRCHNEQHARGIATFQLERGVNLYQIAAHLAARVGSKPCKQ